MNIEEMQRVKKRQKLVESYFVDFSTTNCKEIFLYSSKIFRRIAQTGVIDLFSFIEGQHMFLTNPVYNDIFVKSVNLLEDGATTQLFQFIIGYECNKISNLKQLVEEEIAEIYLLNTCMNYIRINDNIEFETLARKSLMESDPLAFDVIISELSY